MTTANLEKPLEMNLNYQNNRLEAERRDLESHGNMVAAMFTILIDRNDPYKWNIRFLGPLGTPYQGGIFILQIQMTEDYPQGDFTAKFLTPIYHPLVSPETGELLIPDVPNRANELIDVCKDKTAYERVFKENCANHESENDIYNFIAGITHGNILLGAVIGYKHKKRLWTTTTLMNGAFLVVTLALLGKILSEEDNDETTVDYSKYKYEMTLGESDIELCCVADTKRYSNMSCRRDAKLMVISLALLGLFVCGIKEVMDEHPQKTAPFTRERVREKCKRVKDGDFAEHLNDRKLNEEELEKEIARLPENETETTRKELESILEEMKKSIRQDIKWCEFCLQEDANFQRMFQQKCRPYDRLGSYTTIEAILSVAILLAITQKRGTNVASIVFWGGIAASLAAFINTISKAVTIEGEINRIYTIYNNSLPNDVEMYEGMPITCAEDIVLLGAMTILMIGVCNTACIVAYTLVGIMDMKEWNQQRKKLRRTMMDIEQYEMREEGGTEEPTNENNNRDECETIVTMMNANAGKENIVFETTI
ncbi:Oidioi.mRNA.OKI2018_I69.PAR.g8535.t1.cds [Oikopleura dioica]|uniref:Oidioi.mRNA.OKI2018_I69.PAR.g8535.t1.cds n=1 Tax=Oikopleura dioica TaxID=34765 RepID=A0ABN7RJU9_OIKDI|nr:Oidioi.mRNA.OKI2018_I69.PAR.g8535.t1.cds [Oikopleura dioica]